MEPQTKVINVGLSEDDLKALDRIALKLGTRKRPETIRALMREYNKQNTLPEREGG